MIGRAGTYPLTPEKRITSSANSVKSSRARNVRAVLAFAVQARVPRLHASVLGRPNEYAGAVVPTAIVAATGLGTATLHPPPSFDPDSIISKKLLTPPRIVYKIYLVSSLLDLPTPRAQLL